MKRIVSILIILAAMAAIPIYLPAQRPHMGPPHRGPGLERFAEELNLTEEQQTALRELRENLHEATRALREKAYESPEARRETMQAMRESHQKAMEAILTDAQREKLESLKQQMETNREAHQEKRADMRAEMEAYREGKVLPVLRTQRAKLENQLSTEDKAKIAELRAKRTAHREQRPDMQERKRGDRPQPTEEQRAAMRANREVIRSLVEKYDTEITALLAEIQTERETWKEDMQQIREKYAPEAMGERPGKGRERGLRGDRPGRQQGGDHEGRGHKPAGPHHRGPHPEGGEPGKAGFLLLDPTAPAGSIKAADFADIRIFPNPSASRNTATYNLTEAGHYRVEIRDKDGLVIKVLSNDYREAGDYREEIDLSAYSSGTYFLTIVGAKGVVSRKMVVTR